MLYHSDQQLVKDENSAFQMAALSVIGDREDQQDSFGYVLKQDEGLVVVCDGIIKKKGLGFGYRYVLLIFSVGMSIMFFCNNAPKNILLPLAIFCGVLVSFAIGAFFSVSYTVPSFLAAEESKRIGRNISSMYFAIQGLFEGVATGIASSVILVFLKRKGYISYMTIIVAIACMTAFVLSFFLPKNVTLMGKEKKKL